MTAYKVVTTKPEDTFIVNGRTYKDGDDFTPPPNWKRDAEYERIVKRTTFTYDEVSKTRRDLHGQKLASVDTIRVILPVLEV